MDLGYLTRDPVLEAEAQEGREGSGGPGEPSAP